MKIIKRFRMLSTILIVFLFCAFISCRSEPEKLRKSKSEEVIDYLIENVPEINKKAKEIDRLSNGEVSLFMMIESRPDREGRDKYSRDYYSIYVGENHDTHIVNIWRFSVHKDRKDILYWDVISGDLLPLKKWRKSEWSN